MSRIAKLILAAALTITLLIGSLIGLRFAGLIRPFVIPTTGMSPTLSPGEHLYMEGVTYLLKNPRRGDVAVFKTDGISDFRTPSIIVSRLVGLPGEQLKLVDGKLHVNGQPAILRNVEGEIVYVEMPNTKFMKKHETITVPDDAYFMLGDNSDSSYDGRYWGFVPKENVLGRMIYRYWPLDRAGFVK